MKNKKNVTYAMIFALVVVSGLVFANRNIKTEIDRSPKPMSIADKKAALEARKQWEGTPDGIRYKLWEASPAGKKVRASHEKIKGYIKSFANMEAVVTSVTFQREDAKPGGPKWLIVMIDGEDYMMQFTPKEFRQLNGLKVNEKINVKSRSAGNSPNHPYLILSGDYIEQNGKELFKRDFNKNGGC